MNIHAWDLCYKISWINSGRPHEGAFLAKLKSVRNVVERQGYDTGAATLQGRDQCIFDDSTIEKPGKQKAVIPCKSASTASITEARAFANWHQENHTVQIKLGPTPANDGQNGNHPWQWNMPGGFFKQRMPTSRNDACTMGI